MNAPAPQVDSPWPHRLAVALVCATFPMIWVGGLVTTYGAGMAVPDWPNTYGYNIFLYPWETWVHGPWKLFIEHGHRLLGTVVGMLTIGFLVTAFCCQSRKSVRWLSIVALFFVLFQGALGGLRVIEDEVQLAKIHGCVGPAFFAFAVALAAITSKRWQTPPAADRVAAGRVAAGIVERLAAITTFLAYAQLVLGAQLRHLPSGTQPGEFRLTLMFHLGIAIALVVHIASLGVRAARPATDRWLSRPIFGLCVLITLQVVLGCGTWITKYGWPAWMGGYGFAAGYVTTAESTHQAAIVTSHVAIGSLILATSLLVALRAARLASCGKRAQAPRPLALEGAR